MLAECLRLESKTPDPRVRYDDSGGSSGCQNEFNTVCVDFCGLVKECKCIRHRRSIILGREAKFLDLVYV
jgi:hypothetical protein